MRILIVEDDADTCRFIARGLGDLGHQVAVSGDGRDGLSQATEGGFDALVVDRMLPGLDGLSLVRALRAAGNTASILILTAVGGIADRVEGLQDGADDYLVKPFGFAELAARLEALGRRPVAAVDPTRLAVGDIMLDLHRRTVTRAGQRVTLQPREFALLAELVRHPGQVMTRTMLLERVWDFDFEPRTNIVETHLSRLRSKLNASFDTDAIETVRGAGYMIREP
jgi:two-component system OmpR family response regulator